MKPRDLWWDKETYSPTSQLCDSCRDICRDISEQSASFAATVDVVVAVWAPAFMAASFPSAKMITCSFFELLKGVSPSGLRWLL